MITAPTSPRPPRPFPASWSRTTTHCSTLAEATTATDGRRFDLVLLDNHLPDGKAYDFFDQISRRNSDAPVSS